MKSVLAVMIIILFSSCSETVKENIEEIKTESAAVPNKAPVKVDFKQLSSFELPIADPAMADQSDLKFISEAVPESVTKLNNKQITVKGFMVPLQFTKEEKIISFMLTPDQGACCFGKAPALNGVIYCDSAQAYPDLRDILLEVTGTFKTTPVYNKDDKTIYLYTMEIDSIKELKLMPPVKGPEFSF